MEIPIPDTLETCPICHSPYTRISASKSHPKDALDKFVIHYWCGAVLRLDKSVGASVQYWEKTCPDAMTVALERAGVNRP